MDVAPFLLFFLNTNQPNMEALYVAFSSAGSGVYRLQFTRTAASWSRSVVVEAHQNVKTFCFTIDYCAQIVISGHFIYVFINDE